MSMRAKIFAIEVFPVPRGPQNKYACEIRLCSTAFFQRLNDLPLANDFLEIRWPVFAIKRLIRHTSSLLSDILSHYSMRSRRCWTSDFELLPETEPDTMKERKEKDDERDHL